RKRPVVAARAQRIELMISRGRRLPQLRHKAAHRWSQCRSSAFAPRLLTLLLSKCATLLHLCRANRDFASSGAATVASLCSPTRVSRADLEQYDRSWKAD